jgi:hypothetical protein
MYHKGNGAAREKAWLATSDEKKAKATARSFVAKAVPQDDNKDNHKDEQQIPHTVPIQCVGTGSG